MEEEEAFNAEASGSGSQSGQRDGDSAQEVPLSKNQQKKLAKLARYAEVKPLKRQAEKQRRKENAQRLAEGYANGSLSAEDQAAYEERKARQAALRRVKRKTDSDGIPEAGDAQGSEVEVGNSKRRSPMWGGSVIMDLGFDELMTDQEITSMASQLSNSYSTNRLSQQPFTSLIHTSASKEYSPRLVSRLEKLAYDRWSSCIYYPNNLDHFVSAYNASSSQEGPSDQEPILRLPSSLKGKGKQIVYLSADAEEELTTLSEDEVYVIGGLVDRNRHKYLPKQSGSLGITFGKTTNRDVYPESSDPEGLDSESVRLAADIVYRLPELGAAKFAKLRRAKLITQVLHILTEYIAKKDWKEAFETVIPPRKFVEKKRKRGKRPDAPEIPDCNANPSDEIGKEVLNSTRLEAKEVEALTGDEDEDEMHP